MMRSIGHAGRAILPGSDERPDPAQPLPKAGWRRACPWRRSRRCSAPAGTRVEVLERASAELSGASGRLRAGAGMVAGGLEPGGRRGGARACAPTSCTRTTSTRCSGRGLWRRRGRRGGCGDAPAQLPPVLRDRRSATATAGLHALPRPQHAGPAVRLRCRGSLPEAAAYGAGLRASSPRCWRRWAASSRRAPSPPAAWGSSGCTDSHGGLHNFLRGPEFADAPPGGAEYALFAGRLVEEKGVGHGDCRRRRGGRSAGRSPARAPRAAPARPRPERCVLRWSFLGHV